MPEEMLPYYSQPGLMTDPKDYAPLFDELPTDLAGLCQVVQGLMVHIFWAERYGLKLDEARQAEVQIRPVAAKLKRILELDNHPLVEPRPLEKKLVGNCRDFSVLLAAILRYQGVPARARCGFGTYFWPGQFDHYVDHWVVEYWNTAAGRWQVVDAQLDAFQRAALQIPFDALDVPLNVPGPAFVTGGQAWQLCRRGQVAPEQFGIFDLRGWWFIWGNVARELLSLNKIEILPWDYELGLFTHRLEDPPPVEGPELAEYDRLAALTLAGEAAFADLRTLAETDARFHVPEGWKF